MSKLDFIQDSKYDPRKNYMSKIDFVFDSTYHAVRNHMSSEPSHSEYRYPCANNINVKNEVSCVYYSSRNDRGHFGIPKVIFGAFGSGVFIDTEGEWGCCENVAAIPAPKRDLPKIKKALQNPKFLELMQALNMGGNTGTAFPIRAMRYLKKDFWKEFCNE